MAELENSARKQLRATYTPLRIPDGRKPAIGRARAKYALAARLQITPSELERLTRRQPIDPGVRAALARVAGLHNGSTLVEAVQPFAEIDWPALTAIAERLAQLREEDLKALRDIKAARPSRGSVMPARRSHSTNPDELDATLAWAATSAPLSAGVGALATLRAEDAAAASLHTLDQYITWSALRLARTWNHVAAAKEEALVQPVGLLHLERLTFVPAGIERGELVHSVPLSPGEEVNIAHKEWATTSEEFSRIVTDFLEAYSEEGVSEKSELSQSTSSQEQHSSGFNTGVTASGGYGPVSITASMGYTVSDSASRSEQTARDHSSTLTRKASARSKKEHKTTFKVASAAGTEDQQVRKIRNPLPDAATRVDYYQLVRKWRVDLYRYGVRLTYDVMIPEPGVGILAKIQEIEALNTALQEDFVFDEQPNKITKETLPELEAKYGVMVDQPPAGDLPGWEVPTLTQAVVDDPEDSQVRFFPIEFEIPEGYKLSSLTAAKSKDPTEGHGESDTILKFVTPDGDSKDPPDLKGFAGKLSVVVLTKYVRHFSVTLMVHAEPLPGVFEAWQAKAWNTLRDAARARYEEKRANLKQRVAALLEELGGQDALSLRKIEREEVMKGVLRWMLGPDFEFSVPQVLDVDAYAAADTSPKSPLEAHLVEQLMSSIAKQEETIRFLHQAIEWENMLYFLYPYFWSDASRWTLKKYLNHPDPMHRVFLKSGSARVVLTIRPGFEKDFVAFMETGAVGNTHPYLRIAEEMEAYAQTNYPGIRPANLIEGARPLLSPRQRKAWKDMQEIILLLHAYNDAQHAANPALDPAVGVYPSTSEGLGALESLVPLLDADGKTLVATLETEDPWGNPYIYASPGEFNDFDLVCYGADGVKDGEQEQDDDGSDDPDNADITSWAEASLIGRWYEYTPTSALDIAFGETLPTSG
jgi:type II secretory pathway pseudopilin PulG